MNFIETGNDEGVSDGLRFIMDDQKMLNPSYCPLAELVERVMEAVRKAEEKTGQYALYAPNITSRSDHILENALTAIDKGARAGAAAFQQAKEAFEQSVSVDQYAKTRPELLQFFGKGFST